MLLRLAADPDAARAEEEEGEVALVLGDALPGALVLALFRGRLCVSTAADATATVSAPETAIPPVATTTPVSPEVELPLPPAAADVVDDAAAGFEEQQLPTSEAAATPLPEVILPATYPPQDVSTAAVSLQEAAAVETVVSEKAADEVASLPSVSGQNESIRCC